MQNGYLGREKFQRVIKALQKGEIEVINPVIDRSGVRYPALELFGLNPEESLLLLTSLTEIEILRGN